MSTDRRILMRVNQRMRSLRSYSGSRAQNQRCRFGLFVLAAFAVSLVAVPTQAASLAEVVRKAVADAGRPESDKQRDADRKPAETIAFAGIKPGDRIVELFPGDGYFTRILSKVVGDEGRVIAVAPPPGPSAAAGAPEPVAPIRAIAADPRYRNVEAFVQRIPEMSGSQRADLVWTSLNYHDQHNAAKDMSAFNRAMFNALKPGGTYIDIDRAAAPGSGARDTPALHRIDPEIVKTEVGAVGFVFEGRSDLLRNAQDAHTLKTKDPAIRGKTDQFILKFRKPTE